jgi:hypothetical protein
MSARPFYHRRGADRPDLTQSFDLLWNGVEVTTGAQREHRYEPLRAQATERGYDLGPLRSYPEPLADPPHALRRGAISPLRRAPRSAPPRAPKPKRSSVQAAGSGTATPLTRIWKG